MGDYWQDYFNNVSPTWMENWYEQLQDLTIRSTCFRLTSQEVLELLRLADGEADNLVLEQIKGKLQIAFDTIKPRAVFPQFFVRLGSRSPKDNKREIHGTDDVLMSFSDSERILEDLMLCSQIPYNPFVFVREWLWIHRTHEFRCFVKGKELVGISQYFYRERYNYLDQPEIRKLIEWQARKMLTAIKQRGFKLDNFIFDIVYKENDDLPLLVEINPYSSWTDPCLFDWVVDKFAEFEFRWFQVKERLK
jgi:hypothetical protein